VSWDDIDVLLNRVQTLMEPQGYQKMLIYVGHRVGTLAESLPRSAIPPSPNGRPLEKVYTLDGKPSKFKSKKQQGWMFAALKAGKLKLPYKRTGFIINSITHAVNVVDTGVIVTVGTNQKGARYVIGLPGEQSHYHQQTGWLSLPKQIDQADNEIQVEIQRSVTNYVKGYMKGR